MGRDERRRQPPHGHRHREHTARLCVGPSGESGATYQKAADALRDEIQAILTKATQRYNSAATVPRLLVDQAKYGFTDASYADRGSAAKAVAAAEKLAKLAKDPAHMSLDDIRNFNRTMETYNGDPLFAEQFATRLGPKGFGLLTDQSDQARTRDTRGATGGLQAEWRRPVVRERVSQWITYRSREGSRALGWDKSEQAKSEAGGRMQLNQVDPGNGRNGAPDLASTPAQKKAAANAIEQHLEPDTKKAGDVAEEKTNTAVKEFNGKGGHGWDTSDALKKAHGTWEKQVKALMDRLSADKSALRSTHILFQNQDIDIANKVRQSSNLDGY